MRVDEVVNYRTIDDLKKSYNMYEFQLKIQSKSKINSLNINVHIVDYFDDIISGNSALIQKWLHEINNGGINRFVSFVYNLEKTTDSESTIISTDNHNNIRDQRGSPPAFLYRYVSAKEYNDIVTDGYMSPSVFYKRIHASVQPEKQYSEPGGKLLRIIYSDSDGWTPKLGDKVYAVTDKNIPLRKITVISST